MIRLCWNSAYTQEIAHVIVTVSYIITNTICFIAAIWYIIAAIQWIFLSFVSVCWNNCTHYFNNFVQYWSKIDSNYDIFNKTLYSRQEFVVGSIGIG